LRPQYLDVRYLAMAAAPLIGLVPVGARFVAGLRGRTPGSAGATTAILVVAFVGFCLAKPQSLERQPLGLRAAIQAVGVDHMAGARMLIVSDEKGEGAFVSEMAIADLSPTPTVIRASKLLIDADWMNNDLKLNFDTPAKTLEELKDLHVRFIVFDGSVEAQQMPYWAHVKAVIEQGGNGLTTSYRGRTRVDGPTREISVYSLEESPGPPKKLRINLLRSLGRVLEE